MGMRLTRLLVIVATVALMAVAGCQNGGSANLEDDEWQLADAPGSEQDIATFEVTATFETQQVSGRGPVNSYSAPFDVQRGPRTSPADEERSPRLQIGTITRTEMAGSDEANQAEEEYFRLLTLVTTYSIEGDTLTMFDRDEEALLVFER